MRGLARCLQTPWLFNFLHDSVWPPRRGLAVDVAFGAAWEGWNDSLLILRVVVLCLQKKLSTVDLSGIKQGKGAHSSRCSCSNELNLDLLNNYCNPDYAGTFLDGLCARKFDEALAGL